MTATDAFDSWIAFRKPSPQARLRLFCFPYAGAGASIFRTWPDGLPADVEVCPVQFPGRGTRLMERPFTQLSPLVQALAQALAPLLDKPFAFFGHSLGALVGFELARRTPQTVRCAAGSPVCLGWSRAADPSSRPADPCPARKGIPGGTASPEWHSRKSVGACRAHADHASCSAGGFRGLRNLRVLDRAASQLPHLRLWRLAGSQSEPIAISKPGAIKRVLPSRCGCFPATTSS